MKNPSNVLLYTALGDALGRRFEQSRDQIHPDLATWDGSMVAGGYVNLPAGCYTDDTEFSLALAQSLIDRKGYRRTDVMPRYVWAAKAAGIGCGGTLRRAAENFERDRNVNTCGLTEAPYVGSGTVMRAAPLGVVYRTCDKNELRRICTLDASLTHNMDEAKQGSFIVARTIQLLLAGLSVRAAFDAMYREDTLGDSKFTRVDQLTSEWITSDLPRDGQAWSVLYSALALLAIHPWNPTEGLIAAVKVGGDTDTRAAVLGAFYGAMPGLPAPRADWLDVLQNREELKNLDYKLLRTFPEEDTA